MILAQAGLVRSWPPDTPRSRDVKNHVWGEHATEFLATGTAIWRLADEHKLPETSPKPTFTLGLDN